jgi:hypothetical protein
LDVRCEPVFGVVLLFGSCLVVAIDDDTCR